MEDMEEEYHQTNHILWLQLKCVNLQYTVENLFEACVIFLPLVYLVSALDNTDTEHTGWKEGRQQIITIVSVHTELMNREGWSLESWEIIKFY